MTFRIKILFIAFSYLALQSLKAQTLRGEIYNQEDTMPSMFVNVVQVDSTGKILSGTSTSDKGKFILNISKNAKIIRIYHLEEFAEIHVTNLNHDFGDTLDLGKLPLIKAPNYLQVQFKGISEKKEKRNQRQKIKNYNKKVKRYEDCYISINNQTIPLTASNYKQKDTERLKLTYMLNLNLINKKN